VVVFEDDPLTRDVLVKMLDKSGYEVMSFDEPHLCPAYSSAKCECPQDASCGDFLITDNYMPRMSGLEFIRQQQSRGCKGISRNKAVISGSWSAENLAIAEELECKVFFKPVIFIEILRWIKERSCEPSQSD